MLNPSIKIVSLDAAEVKIDLSIEYGTLKGVSIDLCTKLFPDFVFKKKRYQLGQMAPSEEKFEINRTQADKVLIAMRKDSISKCIYKLSNIAYLFIHWKSRFVLQVLFEIG
jgi:hypothetical protein